MKSVYVLGFYSKSNSNSGFQVLGIGTTEVEGQKSSYQYYPIRRFMSEPELFIGIQNKFNFKMEISKVGETYEARLLEEPSDDKMEESYIPVFIDCSLNELREGGIPLIHKNVIDFELLHEMIDDMKDILTDWINTEPNSEIADLMIQIQDEEKKSQSTSKVEPVQIVETVPVVEEKVETVPVVEEKVETVPVVAKEDLRTSLDKDTEELLSFNLNTQEEPVQEVIEEKVTKVVEEEIVATPTEPVKTTQLDMPTEYKIVETSESMSRRFNSIQYEDIVVDSYIPIVIEDEEGLPTLLGIINVSEDEIGEDVDSDENTESPAVTDFDGLLGLDSSDENEVRKVFDSINIKDIYSNSLLLVKNLELKFVVEVSEVDSEFNLDFEKSIRLKNILSSSKQRCLVIPKKLKDINMEVIAECLGEEVESIKTKMEVRNICREVMKCTKNTGIEEQLDNRLFVIEEDLVNLITVGKELIDSYQAEQKNLYGDIYAHDVTARNKDEVNIITCDSEDEVMYLYMPALSELSDKDLETISGAKVSDLFDTFTGIMKQWKYFNCANYEQALSIYKEYLLDKGNSEEEAEREVRDKRLVTVGDYDASFVELYDEEKGFYEALKSIIKTGLITEFDIRTLDELNNVIAEGVFSTRAEKLLKKWACVAFALNRAHTGNVVDNESLLALKYSERSESDRPEYFCKYTLTKIGSGDTEVLQKKYDEVKLSDLGILTSIDGFGKVEEFVERSTDTFRWAKALIKLLRWGKRKPLVLTLSDTEEVFDFNSCRAIQKFEKPKREVLTDLVYVPKEMVIDIIPVCGISNKAEVLPKYKNAIESGEIDSDDTKEIEAITFITLLKADEDASNLMMTRMDTLSFISSLWEYGGIEIDGKLSRVDYIDLAKEIDGRVSVDPDLLVPGNVNGLSFLEKSEPTARMGGTSNDDKIADQYRVLIGSEKISQRVSGDKMINTFENRPNVRVLKDNAEILNNEQFDGIISTDIHRPYEVLYAFSASRNISRRKRDSYMFIYNIGEQLALPYIIADYLYREYTKKYSNVKPESNVACDLEVKLNCLLYGYLSTRKIKGKYEILSMDVEDFLAKVRYTGIVLDWKPNLATLGLDDSESVASGLTNMFGTDKEKILNKINLSDARVFDMKDSIIDGDVIQCRVAVHNKKLLVAFGKKKDLPTVNGLNKEIRAVEQPSERVIVSLRDKSKEIAYVTEDVEKYIKETYGL